MLSVGIIGVGHLGSIHARLWKDQPHVRCAGVFDTNHDAASAKAAELGLNLFATIQECIDTCDLVTIAVPTSLHEQVALQCIEAGKHCLIEKPLAHSVEAGERILQAAKLRGVRVQVGHVERFNPALRTAMEFGLDPHFIEAHRLSRFRPRATDVSVIHDLMIHDIDIVLSLVDSPLRSVSANGVCVLTETVDLVHARLEFENGTVANLNASRLSATPMRKMRMFQKGMYLSLDFAKPGLDVFRILPPGSNSVSSHSIPAEMLGEIHAAADKPNIVFEQPVVEQRNAIADEQAAFVDAVIHNSPLGVSGDDALRALRVACTLEELVESSRR